MWSSCTGFDAVDLDTVIATAEAADSPVPPQKKFTVYNPKLLLLLEYWIF